MTLTPSISLYSFPYSVWMFAMKYSRRIFRVEVKWIYTLQQYFICKPNSSNRIGLETLTIMTHLTSIYTIFCLSIRPLTSYTYGLFRQDHQQFTSSNLNPPQFSLNIYDSVRNPMTDGVAHHPVITWTLCTTSFFKYITISTFPSRTCGKRVTPNGATC